MESILPGDFVEYLYEYAEKQNAAKFSINEIALLACMALTPKGISSFILNIFFLVNVVVWLFFAMQILVVCFAVKSTKTKLYASRQDQRY